MRRIKRALGSCFEMLIFPVGLLILLWWQRHEHEMLSRAATPRNQRGR